MGTHTTSSLQWPDTDAAKQVQARLTEDRTLQAIDYLLQRIDTLERAVESLNGLMQQGPGLIAMAGDMADEAYQKASEKGINIEERLGVALQLAEKFTNSSMLEKVDGLAKLADQMPGLVAMTMDMVDEQMRVAMNNGFDAKALADTATAANRALTKAKAEEPAKIGGIFGLMRALKDPDRQKGLGFLMNFLKHFGKNI